MQKLQVTCLRSLQLPSLQLKVKPDITWVIYSIQIKRSLEGSYSQIFQEVTSSKVSIYNLCNVACFT